MKTCEKCSLQFNNSININGKKINLSRRKYCLVCSPYQSHNTSLPIDRNNIKEKDCSYCKKTKPIEEFRCKDKVKKYYDAWCSNCRREYEKNRWKSRKIEAVKLFDSKCSICGYDKNIASLDFHHLDPRQKEFVWNEMSGFEWQKIISELKKCTLLCKNCHSDLHNPKWKKECVLEYGTDSNNSLNKETDFSLDLNGESGYRKIQSTGVCPECNTPVYGTKYCSVKCSSECNRKIKNRPTKEVLCKELKETNFLVTGKKYGVSDNAIRKWVRSYGLNPKDF
jgi:hypothetical protein